jgi:hypothetical protein
MKLLFIKIVLCILAGSFSAFIFPFDSPDWIKDIVLPLLGVFVGIVIGAVGVFLGGLGALFGGIASLDKYMTKEEIDSVCDELSAVVDEIRSNLLWSLSMFAMCFLSYCVVQFDLPFIEWPSFLWFSKTTGCNGLVFTCIIICFLAMFDSIAAVFDVNRFHELIFRVSINQGKI